MSDMFNTELWGGIKMMTNDGSYIIHWSAANGHNGHGKTKFSEEAAKKICNRMNNEFPDITHWYRKRSADYDK